MLNPMPDYTGLWRTPEGSSRYFYFVEKRIIFDGFGVSEVVKENFEDTCVSFTKRSFPSSLNESEEIKFTGRLTGSSYKNKKLYTHSGEVKTSSTNFKGSFTLEKFVSSKEVDATLHYFYNKHKEILKAKGIISLDD